MRIEDFVGRLAVAGTKPPSIVDDLQRRLNYVHEVLARLSHRARKEGRDEASAVFEEARRAAWSAKRVLDARQGKPAHWPDPYADGSGAEAAG